MVQFLLSLTLRTEKTHQHSTLNLDTVAIRKTFLPNFQEGDNINAKKHQRRCSQLSESVPTYLLNTAYHSHRIQLMMSLTLQAPKELALPLYLGDCSQTSLHITIINYPNTVPIEGSFPDCSLALRGEWWSCNLRTSRAIVM